MENIGNNPSVLKGEKQEFSENSRAIIFGASGGIGLTFLKSCLVDRNFSLVIATYRDRSRAAGVFQLANQFPDRLQAVPLDVTQERDINQVPDILKSGGDSLHLAINCIGVLHEGSDFQPEKRLEQLSTENLLHYFQVNSLPTALLADKLLPFFRHGDRSVFATISAKVGSIGDNRIGGWYGYRASKAALNMFIKTAAVEYRRRSPNTILAALHPGTTDTHLSKPFQGNVPPEKLFSSDRTVSQLMDIIYRLNSTHSGEFFSWDGTPLPW
ncbi:MAG: SDR family NAD(P)-dependent oxidoreductase [Cyanobacteria bacterium P01_F01_bin.153]